MRRFPRKEKGMTLIEALVGLVIFSFGILGLIGLQAVTVRDTMDAKYRIDAGYLANQIIATMWVDRTNLSNYDTSLSGTFLPRDNWKAAVDTLLPGANGTDAPTITVSGTQVDITVRWKQPGEATARRLSVSALINGA